MLLTSQRKICKIFLCCDKPCFPSQIKDVLLAHGRSDLWDSFERFALLKGLEQLGRMVYCPRKVQYVIALLILRPG